MWSFLVDTLQGWCERKNPLQSRELRRYPRVSKSTSWIVPAFVTFSRCLRRNLRWTGGQNMLFFEMFCVEERRRTTAAITITTIWQQYVPKKGGFLQMTWLRGARPRGIPVVFPQRFERFYGWVRRIKVPKLLVGSCYQNTQITKEWSKHAWGW